MKYFAALGIALLVIAAASVGPWAPSPFTSQTGTNTTAAAWRTALGAAASSSLSGYVTNHTGAATNLALTGGSVTTQTNTDLTASRVVVSSASKVLASSSVTSTTLGYLDATSSVQTQLDSKPTVALTNVALLNTSQTFTQTNTFSTNTVLGTNRVGDFLGEGARWVRLFRTNQVSVTMGGAVTNVFCAVPVPSVLSSNAQFYFTFGAWKPSAQTANTFWDMRENTTNGPIISGLTANSATVLANEVVPARFLTLTDFTRAFGLGAAANGNNTVNTNYLGSVDWRTNNTIQVMLYNSSAATNVFTVEYFEVLYRY